MSDDGSGGIRQRRLTIGTEPTNNNRNSGRLANTNQEQRCVSHSHTMVDIQEDDQPADGDEQ